MKIVGISGVDGAKGFKRRQWPGLEEREYRICQGHDSAAALVIDGEFVSGVAEERISRSKHCGDFPVGALGACLAQASVALDEIDEIVHAFDYTRYRPYYMLDPVSAALYRDVLSPEAFASQVKRSLPSFPADRIAHVDHHLAHAASAFFTSGWDQCLVVIIDGMGEAHGATVYRADGYGLEPIHRIPAQDSLGIFYSVITLHLGFEFNSDEYKIMGLAPYGNPDRFRGFFDEAVVLRADGGWVIPSLRLNRTREERENHTATRRQLAEVLVAARAPDDELTDDHRDVAAGLQACLDRALLHMCAHFHKAAGARRLAMAGGVALNTTANGKLLEAGLFDEVYVQPAAGDDGSALGAALQRAAYNGEVSNRRQPVPFYGPAYGPEQIEEALARFRDRIEITPLESLASACDAAADLLADGQVLAWYRGRMEFGPRALGHRSILADPGRPDMRDRVNAMVKMREAFRPFAPAVSLREVHHWFEVAPGAEFPYMVANVNVRRAHRADLPAVTHVDGSSRVQTVSPRDDADFHALLVAFGRRTGREVVLNTSFNVKGQPIVNTPTEAIETFLSTGLDALFLENVLVRKTRRPGVRARWPRRQFDARRKLLHFLCHAPKSRRRVLDLSPVPRGTPRGLRRARRRGGAME